MKSYTADICDKYTKKIQVLDPILNSFGGISMCHGKIITIELYEDNSSLIKLLRDTQGNGRICVVNVIGNHCAVVGETLMGFAYHNNWKGIIINGYVRDTHQTSQIPVGLWAKGTYPLKSSKIKIGKLNTKFTFGSIKFKSNQYVYADRDGIIISKKEIIL